MNPKTELGVALAFTALIAAGLYLTTRIDLAFSIDLEQFSGPRTYPRIVFGVMLFFNVLLVAQQLLRLREPAADLEGAAAEPLFAPDAVKVLWLVLALLAFNLLYEPAGYLLTMLPLMFVVAKMCGAKRNGSALLACAALYLACLAIFRYGLNTVLPEGLLGIDAFL